MTIKGEFTQALVDLVEGRIDPTQWDAWWTDHGPNLLQFLNPGQVLRFRMAASPNESPISRIAQCQGQAAELLKLWNVPASLDPAYGDQARQEWRHGIRAVQQQMKLENNARRNGISRFDSRFPGFAAFLRRRRRDLDDLGPPATPLELKDLEGRIGGTIPPSLQSFLLCARSLRLGDLIQLDIDDMATIDFSNLPERQRPSVHGIILLSEFWLESDGDQLAFDQNCRVNEECPIFYYAHEYRPPRVTQVANTFDALLAWWAKGAKAWTRTLKE